MDLTYYMTLATVFLVFITILGLIIIKINYRNIVLIAVFISFAYLCFILYLVNSGNYNNFPLLLLGRIPANFYSGPFWLLFIYSITKNKTIINKKDLIHFIPFIISVIIISSILPDKDKHEIGKILAGADFSNRTIYSLSLICRLHFISYLVYSVYLLKINFTDQNKKQYFLLIIASLLGITMALLRMIIIIFKLPTDTFSIQSFFGLSGLSAIMLIYFYIVKNLYINENTKKNQRKSNPIYLDKLNIEKIENRLNNIMLNENIYCDAEIDLKRLSNLLELTQHQLSEFLNQHYNLNFNTFINNFRIKKAQKELLENPEKKTIEISYDIGYNSYSTFFAAFKKITGLSPEEYKNNKNNK